MAKGQKGAATAAVAVPVAAMTIEQKIRQVKGLLILSPRHEELIAQFDLCRSRSQFAGEPVCMLLLGWQGVGKTTTTQVYAQMHPRQTLPGGDRVPVVTYEIDAPATVKGMVSGLLEALGDPHAHRGGIPAQTSRLRHLLKACGTELLILDEFQHCLDADSPKALKLTSDWLKGLINKTGIPIVMCGMPYSRGILYARHNKQLRERFQVHEELESYGWGPTSEERKPFRGFLSMVDAGLPLQPSNLSDVDTAYRIYCATNGFPRHVMTLIREAAIRAIERGLPFIDLPLLAEVYEGRYRREYPRRQNPFNVQLSDLKVVPFEEAEPELKRLRQVIDQESMSDVVKKR